MLVRFFTARIDTLLLVSEKKSCKDYQSETNADPFYTEELDNACTVGGMKEGKFKECESEQEDVQPDLCKVYIATELVVYRTCNYWVYKSWRVVIFL